jgi:hypothetical protein
VNKDQPTSGRNDFCCLDFTCGHAVLGIEELVPQQLLVTVLGIIKHVVFDESGGQVWSSSDSSSSSSSRSSSSRG